MSVSSYIENSQPHATRKEQGLVRGAWVRCLIPLFLLASVACAGADDASGGASVPPGGRGGNAAGSGTGGSATGGGTGGSSTSGGAGGSATSGGTGGSQTNGGANGGAPAVEAVVESVELDRTVWHAGFEWTFSKATFTVEAGSSTGTLTIDANLTNLSTASNTPNSRLTITDGTNESLLDASGGFTAVVGERSKDFTLTTEVDADFDFERATLVVGSPSNNQAIVPIGEDSPDDFLSLEPLDLELEAELVAGNMGISIEKTVLRAHAMDDEADAEHLFLRFYFSASLVEKDVGGGENLFTENFVLETPDNTALASTTNVGELLDSVGIPIDDLVLEFLLPKPVAGKYALAVGGRWAVEGNDYVEDRLEFEIPEPENFAD